MTELNGPNFSVNNLNFQGVKKTKQETPQIASAENETPQLTDFSDPKAESLGRSMLFKGADNIKHDLKTLMNNPEVAENSDKVFEASYKLAQDAGLENPYEEASEFSTGNLN